MTGVDVRPATPDDAEDVQRVARESWHAAYDATLGAEAVERIVGEWYDLEGLKQSISDEDSHFLIAETDRNGESLGFAHAVLGDEDGPAWLPRIYVRPDRWGDGIGSELLGRVESWLREEDADRLRLGVIADNEVGNAFYERRGYEVIEERDEEVFDVRFEEYVREKEL